MFPNYHWYEMVAYERITEGRRAAAHDRLAAVVVQAAREAQQPAGSILAGLFRLLASGLGFSRPALRAMTQEPQAE